jgi:hypothetical protein
LFSKNEGTLNAALRLERTSRRTELGKDDFVRFYPYPPHYIDLCIGIMSGIRLQPGAPRHFGGSNRTIIKHGIDIDLRAVQIAGLALWLRCQRYWSEVLGPSSLAKDKAQWTRDQGLRTIRKSKVVCAEPMPGEERLLTEFLKTINDDRLEDLMRRVSNVPKGARIRATRAMADSLGDLVRSVWQNMTLAGEVGSLLKVEDALQDAIASAQADWEEKLPLFRMTRHEAD